MSIEYCHKHDKRYDTDFDTECNKCSQSNEIYKGYEISSKPNYWGYYEATEWNNCDAFMVTGKTIDEVKNIIDEL